MMPRDLVRAGLRLRTYRFNAPLVAAAVATLGCALLFLGHATGRLRLPYLDVAEVQLVDVRFRLRGSRAPADRDIVIVALDDATRSRAPELFQKRAGWARLITAIAAERPVAIAVDAFWSSPERVLPEPVVVQAEAARAQLLQVGPERQGPELAAGVSALDAVLAETRGDAQLAEAVRAAGVVVLGVLLFVDDAPASAGAAEPKPLAAARFGEAVNAATPSSRRPPAAAAAVVSSLPELAAGAVAAGLVNTVVDADGATRRVYGAIERAGRFYAPLGLVMAKARLGPSVDLSVVVGDDRILLGERALPSDRRARLSLDYLGAAGTFPTVSAADVVGGTLAPGTLVGKLVFVGFTDVARDTVETPFDPRFPGVEVHATLAHNALHGELLRHTGAWVTLAVILALGGLLTFLQRRAVRGRGSWRVIAVSAGALVGFVGLAYALFVGARVIVDVAAPVATFVIVALASLSVGLVVEGREKLQIKQAFSQYLDDRAIAQILADPAKLKLGGERRELTVLFSDIRGFSLLSETLDPQQLSAFLNEYLTPMTDLVLESGGLLDKYIGDAVMAVWGAPLDQADHAARACKTALAMQRRLVELNRSFAARGLPKVAVGIGISAGGMSVGNMGSARRFDYTVVGDSVNLGSRLEALTKDYGSEILVSERVEELTRGEFVYRELDRVRIKGKDRVVRVFELLGDSSTPVRVDLVHFAKALAAYRAARFDEAEAGFGRALEHFADDGPALALRERCRRLASDPPLGWDGVYEQADK
jgi:adenylate cyclase